MPFKKCEAFTPFGQKPPVELVNTSYVLYTPNADIDQYLDIDPASVSDCPAPQGGCDQDVEELSSAHVFERFFGKTYLQVAEAEAVRAAEAAGEAAEPAPLMYTPHYASDYVATETVEFLINQGGRQNGELVCCDGHYPQCQVQMQNGQLSVYNDVTNQRARSDDAISARGSTARTFSPSDGLRRTVPLPSSVAYARTRAHARTHARTHARAHSHTHRCAAPLQGSIFVDDYKTYKSMSVAVKGGVDTCVEYCPIHPGDKLGNFSIISRAKDLGRASFNNQTVEHYQWSDVIFKVVHMSTTDMYTAHQADCTVARGSNACAVAVWRPPCGSRRPHAKAHHTHCLTVVRLARPLTSPQTTCRSF